jgi:hypothetical protein
MKEGRIYIPAEQFVNWVKTGPKQVLEIFDCKGEKALTDAEQR